MTVTASVSLSVGGSFAAKWALMVLKKCSSERWGREKRFYVGRRSERRRTAFWRAAQNTLGASGAKPTRTSVTRTVNGTGQYRSNFCTFCKGGVVVSLSSGPERWLPPLRLQSAAAGIRVAIMMTAPRASSETCTAGSNGYYGLELEVQYGWRSLGGTQRLQWGNGVLQVVKTFHSGYPSLSSAPSTPSPARRWRLSPSPILRITPLGRVRRSQLHDIVVPR